MKKVLIIGSTGMAGHVVYKHFESLKKYDLFDISFRQKLNDTSIILDVRNAELLEDKILEISPDVIINCVGILIKGSKTNPANAIYINSYLPHQLADLAEKINSKFIHLSTDCVYSGDKGNYLENDFRDADDTYGRSKTLGEINYNNHLTIRTSIIGPELKTDGEGLMHWFFNQSGEVNGFEKAIWSGVTTLELAKGIDAAINDGISGIYHLTNSTPINKYELLSLFKDIWDLREIKINSIEGKEVNKSLIDSRHEITRKVPSYREMLVQLLAFMQQHKSLYQHYENLEL